MKKYYTCIVIVICYVLLNNTSNAQGIPAREESKINQVYSQYGLTGEGTVIAIIDRGIDYFHTDFIDENGKTRLLYLYDMINPEGANDPGNPYGIGTIFTEEEINASLENGEPPLSMDRYGHGTATTGIAAGNGSGTADLVFMGVAPKAKIIVIKAIQDNFPAFDDQPGQDGFYNPTYIPIALQFIADKVDSMPTVALLNMGSIGGPTDGTSTIARAMNDFVDLGHVLVCGVGDDGGADNHASATVIQGESIELNIQKGETGNLRFELWYSDDDRFEVTITRPDNSTEGPFPAPATANDADDRFLTGINYYHRGENMDFSGATSNRRQLMIDFTGATGEYKISLKGTSIDADGKFHAVLNSSTHSNNNKFLSHVEEGYAINDFASSEKSISPTDYVVKSDWVDMGGIQRQMTGQGDPGELWIGSSFGPTQDNRIGVDFAACGEVLYAAYSANTWYSHFPHLLVQGGGNNYGIQNAVSASAPLTTGVIALMLDTNPNLTPDMIKQILQQTARSDSYTGTVPNNKWGYGKLDALEAVEEAETTGIFSIKDNQFDLIVYPNPARDFIILSFDKRSSEKVERIQVINMQGQEVAISEGSNSSLRIGHLPIGIYNIIIHGKFGISSSKFIKH